jgi:hypothetical protein
MSAAIKLMGNAHESAAQSGHCMAGASCLPDLKLESPQSGHGAATPALFWTQFAKAHTGC